MRLALALALVALASPVQAQDEASLRLADAAQHDAARNNDGEALTRMAHANFRLYAPEGYIAGRERLLGRFRSPETGYTRFERTVESAAVTGKVGIIMGRETIARSDARVVTRRFTNIWIWEKKRWQWLARHAQVDQENFKP
mgnify:CR=1 FL=1